MSCGTRSLFRFNFFEIIFDNFCFWREQTITCCVIWLSSVIFISGTIDRFLRNDFWITLKEILKPFFLPFQEKQKFETLPLLDSSLFITATWEMQQNGSLFKLPVGSFASIGLKSHWTNNYQYLTYARFLCGGFLAVRRTVQFFKSITVSAFDQSMALDPSSLILALHLDCIWLQIAFPDWKVCFWSKFEYSSHYK